MFVWLLGKLSVAATPINFGATKLCMSNGPQRDRVLGSVITQTPQRLGEGIPSR